MFGKRNKNSLLFVYLFKERTIPKNCKFLLFNLFQCYCSCSAYVYKLCNDYANYY